MSIPVYIISDSGTPRDNVTQQVFADPTFNVITPSIPALPVNNKNINFETYQVYWVLADAYKNYPNSAIIITKNTSVSTANPASVANITISAMNSGQFDLLYLSRWLDRCELLTDKTQVNDTGAFTAKTMSPNGMQCILFSTNGRDILLGNTTMKNGNKFVASNASSLSDQLNGQIYNGNITAFAVTPNLIEYDIQAADKSTDYIKTQECAQVLVAGSSNASTGLMAAVIFIIILLLVVIVAWLAVKVSRR